MADNFNPADNLSNEARSKGGKHSSGNFKNDPKRASEAGKKGAEAQPIEAKRKGGENSHRNDS